MGAIQYDADELVPVDLDRPRNLLFTVAALRKICAAADERDMRKAIGKLLSEGEFELGGAVTLLWAGLLHEDPTLTQDQLEQVLTPGRLVRAQAALRKALQGDGGHLEDAPADPPTATASGS